MVALSAQSLPSLAERLPVPRYDRGRVRPGVVHIGVGGFHRAHMAVYHDTLLHDSDTAEWGICGVGVLPGDAVMRDALLAQDGLYTLVLRDPAEPREPRVIGSIVEFLLAPDDPEAVIEKLADPATRIVSLTITEGGYGVDDATGAFDPSDPLLAVDLTGLEPPRTAFGLIVEALRRRRERGEAPFAVLSCDNMQGNGDVARTAVSSFAFLRDPELGEWVRREVAFPNSVVDRITPATTDADRHELRERTGVEDRWPVVCEPFTLWVLEDVLDSRPPWERAGAQLVADVEPYELMKLRLLNAGHQAIAYFGRLLGHEYVDEALADPALRGFLTAYLEEEATPTLDRVPAAQVAAYREAVLERFANTAVRDRLERLCVDTSDRIPKFLLPLVRERLAAGQDVRRCAAIVASWARYTDGTDEQGRPFEVVDRRRGRLKARARVLPDVADGFLDDAALFGDLGRDERFATAYRAALASLYARGARATLSDLGPSRPGAARVRLG